MPTFLERYLRGEYEQVWTDLTSLGERVRDKPLLADALGVASETMRRARTNIDTLVCRLLDIGYEFQFPLTSDDPLQYVVFAPPRSDVKERIAEIEQLAGPLPLSLRSWYEIVGTVNFMGKHTGWPDIYSDPLVVHPIEEVLRDYRKRMEYRDELIADGAGTSELDADYFGLSPYFIPIAPDYYHKADVSGGAPYGIEVPAPTADAVVVEEWHNTTFVNYLRTCFQWGGFPGFERYGDRPAQDFDRLCIDLLPL